MRRFTYPTGAFVHVQPHDSWFNNPASVPSQGLGGVDLCGGAPIAKMLDTSTSVVLIQGNEKFPLSAAVALSGGQGNFVDGPALVVVNEPHYGSPDWGNMETTLSGVDVEHDTYYVGTQAFIPVNIVSGRVTPGATAGLAVTSIDVDDIISNAHWEDIMELLKHQDYRYQCL